MSSIIILLCSFIVLVFKYEYIAQLLLGLLNIILIVITYKKNKTNDTKLTIVNNEQYDIIDHDNNHVIDVNYDANYDSIIKNFTFV